MTLDDLAKALEEAIATEKIGTPVSLRINLQLPDENTILSNALPAIMQIVDNIFSSKPGKLMARQHDEQNQLNLLIDYHEGQTVSLTLGRGSTDQTELNLLLIGNHGVIRLEGEELFDDSKCFSSTDTQYNWMSQIEESIANNTAVSLC